MPLELACDDAEYAVQSFDLYDGPGGIGYVTPPGQSPRSCYQSTS